MRIDDTFIETYKLIHWHNDNLWSVVRDLQINESREREREKTLFRAQCKHRNVIKFDWKMILLQTDTTIPSALYIIACGAHFFG